MEDRELIRRIQNGQKQYLNVIAEKYYNDIYYFNRVFRKAVDCSPMEFRKNGGRAG